MFLLNDKYSKMVSFDLCVKIGKLDESSYNIFDNFFAEGELCNC